MPIDDIDILTGEPAATARAGGASTGSGCGCGCAPEAGDPELDVRGVPHALRHGTVFGALGAVPAGEAMVLVAPHDPPRC